MRLQNIRLPEPEICSEETLYYHRAGTWLRFDGYFNLFYIEKWKTYTDFKSLELHLRLRDCESVRLMHDETVLSEVRLENNGTSGREGKPEAEREGKPETDRERKSEAERERITEMAGKTEGVQELVLQVPLEKFQKGVFWFAVKADSHDGCKLPEVSGWYEGESEHTWPVRIAAVVCTYRRESYVLRNLKQVVSFLQKPENQALRLCYWLVDNGRTLTAHAEIQELEKSYPDVIRIIPNQNTGGAGGFTWGMMEAIQEKEAMGLTHVLLMDDDAVFDPELFVRAYGFLRGRKEKYREIRLGGTLFREDYPYLCQAMGEWFEKLTVKNDHVLTDLRFFETCCQPFAASVHDEERLYSGWWCCCYSLDTVRSDNLPLQLFIHRDDIEYEVRNRKTGVVFLNGIGVWHKGFEVNFLGVNSYYDVRNGLIFTALHEPDTSVMILWKWICKVILSSVMRFRYEEVRLAARGVVDFLKGPAWVFAQNPENLHKSLQAEIPPSGQIQGELPGVSVEKLRAYYSPERRAGQWVKKMTFNGWFLPDDREMGTMMPMDSPFIAFRKNKLRLVDIGSGKERIGKKNWKEFFQAIAVCVKLRVLLRKRYESAAEEYRSRMNIQEDRKAE